ncbi:MAG: OmpA family protein [Rhodospirillaceae bacterium]|nr:OmpA family protein [Rhodospirillaceae bacterium]
MRKFVTSCCVILVAASLVALTFTMTSSVVSLEPPLYFVFFDEGAIDITEDEMNTINEVVHLYSEDERYLFDLVGYDDTFGTTDESMTLSILRVEAVAAEIIRLGVEPHRVFLSARGEADPLVLTPDGVHEPSNRRVEIRPQCCGNLPPPQGEPHRMY